MTTRLPQDYDVDSVCLSFDVEWAHDDIVADTVALLDERGLRGTFFVTHEGVSVTGHERGLHPNFRRNGDLYRALHDAPSMSDSALFEDILKSSLAHAREAKGVRTHSLFYDTALLAQYRNLGIEYDATLRLELVAGLRPFWKQCGILEIPTYYADYFDMDVAATGWDISKLHLDASGLKVFDFHPLLVYINAPNVPYYDAVRPFYNDVDRLRGARYEKKGARTLFIALLDELVRRNATVVTAKEINQVWRSMEVAW
jgi:hypothetical protein